MLSNIHRLYAEGISISKKAQRAPLLQERSIFFSLPASHPAAHGWSLRKEMFCFENIRQLALQQLSGLRMSEDQELRPSSASCSQQGMLLFHQELDAISFCCAWKITPVCRAHNHLFSTACTSQVLLLDLGMQNLRGERTWGMKEKLFLKFSFHRCHSPNSGADSYNPPHLHHISNLADLTPYANN